jgi:ATP-dependent DNA helicase RecQ
MQAKLIQTNDSFNLYDLAEIRFFMSQLNTGEQSYVINDEVWEDAVRVSALRFKSSDNWIICENLIKDFGATNKKIKYLSDLEVFIRESKLEDFYPRGGETIFVSTIHKAKGKEFDNVFLMLENLAQPVDDFIHQLYVAITRAKNNLVIHTNTRLFDGIKTSGLIRTEHMEQNMPPAFLATHLTYNDVWLDYFYNTQSYLSTLVAGNDLIISEDECLNTNRQPILKFSNQFSDRIKEQQLKGYSLKSARVNFVLYWQKKDTDQEIKIVLPKLYFEKVN